MPDREVENYKKSVSNIVEHWSKEIKKDADDIAAINEALENIKKQKEGKGPLRPYKSPEELKKDRKKLMKSIERKKHSLEVNLKLLPPPKRAPKKETSKLPGFIQEIIKKKGIPVGGIFVLKPDVSFDLDEGTIKKAKLDLVWEF